MILLTALKIFVADDTVTSHCSRCTTTVRTHHYIHHWAYRTELCGRRDRELAKIKVKPDAQFEACTYDCDRYQL